MMLLKPDCKNKYLLIILVFFIFGLFLKNSYADEIPPPPADSEHLIPNPPEKPAAPYVYKAPKKLADGWKVGNLRKQKANLQQIAQGIDKIQGGTIPDVHSVVVVRHGKIVLEEYFKGYGAKYPNPLFSCTKSVFSTVFGIAQDQGLINVDQKLYDLYPEWRAKPGWEKQKDDITVGMMLSMTSGLNCNDVGTPNCGVQMGETKDWLAFAFDIPMAHKPGTFWMYNGCCLSLISNLITQKSGMSLVDYSKKYLFDPLGIENDGWVMGPNGVNRVDYGLAWKARDMAKLGQLYLNGGKWEGKQVLSEAWVKDATSLHAPVRTSFGHSYGYLWHLKDMTWKGKTIQIFYANGYQGQAIFVSPDADTVCVMTASSNDDMIYGMEESFFEDNVLGSIN